MVQKPSSAPSRINNGGKRQVAPSAKQVSHSARFGVKTLPGKVVPAPSPQTFVALLDSCNWCCPWHGSGEEELVKAAVEPKLLSYEELKVTGTPKARVDSPASSEEAERTTKKIRKTLGIATPTK